MIWWKSVLEIDEVSSEFLPLLLIELCEFPAFANGWKNGAAGFIVVDLSTASCGHVIGTGDFKVNFRLSTKRNTFMPSVSNY